MKANVLKFKNDIKKQVEIHTGKVEGEDIWMFPLYTAYYMIKHCIENKDQFINDEIRKSYKALSGYTDQVLYKKLVIKYVDEYAETVCPSRENS